MNDPDAITPEEAAEILGISRESSAPQVERAYAEKLEALEKKIAQAATAALKNKYRIAMDRLKLAREALEKPDEGCDLPAMEISEVAARPPTPAAAPAPASAPETPKAAPSTPATPKKPLPMKAIGLGLAAVLVIGLAIVLLQDPATAVYVGDYRKRISYETVVYDYSLSVAKDGVITGTNQVADKNSKPVNITGKVDDKGAITATGDDKSRYIGQINGEDMELEEKFESSKSVVFTLGKGIELPTEAPQAKWAGVYHNPAIEYPAGKYEMRFEVAANGDVTALSRKLTNEKGSTFKGRVNTKGKVTATWNLSEGKKVEYTGTVGADEMILKETLADGTAFNIKLTKGEKKSVKLSPHAGVYRNRINYATVVYDFDVTVAEDGSLKGTNQVADGSSDPVAITGQVDDQGAFTATGSDKTPYTGSIQKGEMEINEKVKDKSFTFTLIKDKKLPAGAPQAAFAGTYANISVIDPNGAAYEYEFTITPEGKLTGSYTSANGSISIQISGKVGTKGKITGEGQPFTDGFKNTYTGSVTDEGLELTETLRNGKSFTFTVPKS